MKASSIPTSLRLDSHAEALVQKERKRTGKKIPRIINEAIIRSLGADSKKVRSSEWSYLFLEDSK